MASVMASVTLDKDKGEVALARCTPGKSISSRGKGQYKCHVANGVGVFKEQNRGGDRGTD